MPAPAEVPKPARITRAVPGQAPERSIAAEVLAVITATLDHSESAEVANARRNKIRQSIAERTRGGSDPLAHCEVVSW